MIKTIGAALIVASTAAAGISRAFALKKRCRALCAMQDSLELLRTELYFRLTPLPELITRLSEIAPEPVRRLFSRLSGELSRLGDESFSSIWRRALADTQELCLRREETRYLGELGSVLGRYDLEGQSRALELAEKRLAKSVEGAESELRTHGKMYTALGISSGLAIVILFF